MLTIFTVPKPFQGHIETIQRNAIWSWKKLSPACEIILCGNEVGCAEVAVELGVKHIPDIKCNEYGTPLLDSVFELSREYASHPLLCYVNADIILIDDFLLAVGRIPFHKFLMVGQRWNLDIQRQWDFEQSDWLPKLRGCVEDHGVLQGVGGSDYFVFPKNSELWKLPSFAVGRLGWDNWMIYNARKLKFPVVDATQDTLVIHQNHSYVHVPQRRGPSWEGPESDTNRELAGGEQHIFTLYDATHILTRKSLKKALSKQHIKRRWYSLPILYPALYPIMQGLYRTRDRYLPWLRPPRA